MLQLGVTREASQLTALSSAASQRGVRLVPLPVISVEPVSFSLPPDFDIQKVDWIFFTSANGVSAFFDRLSELNLQLSPNTKIAAVGEKTSIAVSSYEHTTDFIPEAAYGKQLFQEFIQSTPVTGATVIYARGESINFDPAALFDSNQVKYFPLICYRTTPNRVPDSLLGTFSANDFILFTAPSAVSSFNEQFGKPQAKPIAIGKTTAGRMDSVHWHDFILMDQPDIDKVLEYI